MKKQRPPLTHLFKNPFTAKTGSASESQAKSRATRPPLSLETFVLSAGGVGFIPWAPGTWGSFITLPLLFFFNTIALPPLLLIPLLVVLTVGSSYITEHYQKMHGIHDPSWIVIDEVLGMLTTWCLFPASQPITLFILFLFFRFFDIFKPWPICVLDRNKSHGVYVILDDICAGLIAGGTLLLIEKIYLNYLSTYLFKMLT